MSEQNNEENRILILMEALKDAQGTIRGLDSKVSFLLAFMGVVLGGLFYTASNYVKLFKSVSATYISIYNLIGFGLFIFSSLVLLIALWLLFLILSPKTSPIGHLKNKEKDTPKNAFFYLYNMNPSHLSFSNLMKPSDGEIRLGIGLKEVEEMINKSEIKSILIFELLKLSYLRELKVRRLRIATNLTFWGVIIFIVAFLLRLV